MKTSLPLSKAGKPINVRQLVWLRKNYGVFARIARELSVSEGKVRQTFHGLTHTADPAVTKALAEAGAPGFSE
jgi:hypothetical protein